MWGRSVIVSLCTAALLAGIAPAASSAETLVTYTGAYVIPDGDYRMTIDTTGLAATELGHETGAFHLTARQLRHLRTRLREARWSTLASRYRRRSGEPPLVGGGPQSITYRGKRVRIDPGAKVPRRLHRVYRILSRHFEDHKPA